MSGEVLVHWLSAQLVSIGPGLLFLICLLETAIFAGLILPVGALIAFSAMLAARGVFAPADVIVLALLGALVGDQLGFVVGRWFIAGARPPRGPIARIWRGALDRTEGLVRSRGGIGVTVARAIPFVRTVMPWFAGRSGIHWGRFLVFDILGVGLWGAIYLGGGFLAGESWRQVAARYGEVAGAVLAIVVIAGFVLLNRPRRARSLQRQ